MHRQNQDNGFKNFGIPSAKSQYVRMGGGSSALTSLATNDLPEIDPAICTHKFCEKWGPGHFHCADCHSTITNETLMAEEDRIIDGIVDDSVPEDGVNRGVSIQFLVDFATACNCWHMTTRDVRRRFVMPATRATRCRFVELSEMASVVGRATTFVSHTWGAKFGDLVAALCDGNADRSRIVWVDIFAVRQWPSHKPDLDFSAVVRQCQSFVIVCSAISEFEIMTDGNMFSKNIMSISLESRTQIAFLRVWCLVELHAAISCGCIIIMKVGRRFEESFVTDVAMIRRLVFLVDIEQAEATVEADKERILNDIRSAVTSVAEMNDVLRGVLSGAITSVDDPIVQCAACNDAFALLQVLKNPSKYVFAAAGGGFSDLLRNLLSRDKDGPPRLQYQSSMIGFNAHIADISSMCAAALGGHLKCVELLLEREVEYRDEAALVSAAMGGHARVIEFLLSRGFNVTVRDVEGCSALTAAAMGGHLTCVEILLKNGALVREEPAIFTALMAASRGGHTASVELLLKAGCDVQALDKDELTALEYAKQGGHSACIELIEKSIAG